MMMGKGKNTAVYPRGHTKMQQLAEICGTWLTYWQCSSKWKMKRECLIYWMSAAELNIFFSQSTEISTAWEAFNRFLFQWSGTMLHSLAQFVCPFFSWQEILLGLSNHLMINKLISTTNMVINIIFFNTNTSDLYDTWMHRNLWTTVSLQLNEGSALSFATT